jgi:hypothetical protein
MDVQYFLQKIPVLCRDAYPLPKMLCMDAISYLGRTIRYSERMPIFYIRNSAWMQLLRTMLCMETHLLPKILCMDAHAELYE